MNLEQADDNASISSGSGLSATDKLLVITKPEAAANNSEFLQTTAVSNQENYILDRSQNMMGQSLAD
jgi:hypothetical protein